MILALDQHFTYYINMWYVEYFRDSMALTSTYKIHYPMIGQTLSADQFNAWLGVIFTPWISQVYLTMAAFNLAKRDRVIFSENLASKLKLFGLIFLFFVMENFMVAPNTGQAISFYPIMLWMIVLGIISVVYSLMSIQGVLVLTLLSMLRWILPIDMISDLIQGVVIHNIHPGFEYDARIEYFFASACLGFIMGYVHHQLPRLERVKDLYFIILGAVFVLIYAVYGDPMIIDPSNAFANEHSLAITFSGTLYILGIQAIVLSVFLWLEKKGIQFNLKVITWIGVNSLLIFAFHRVFFVRFLAPVSLLVGNFFNRTIGASTFEVYTYITITILFCYFVQQSKIFDYVINKKG